MLLKQYFCDVDVGHLISFNEELAHRLTTEPAEIIPLVRIQIPGTENLLLIMLSVRSRAEKMHTSHRLPLTKGHYDSRTSATSSLYSR